MTNSLEVQIEYLNHLILRMFNQVAYNMDIAFDAYLNFDESKNYNINDDIVDKQERLIEEECLDILVKERPYARDLRMVSGIMNMVQDIERLGDHAEDLLNFSLKLKKEEPLKEVKDLILILAQKIKDIKSAYINRDIKRANEIILEDDYIDSAYEAIINKLIELSKNQKISSEFAIYTTLVVKYIERIADHCVNVCEWIIYIENGYYKDKQIF